MKYTLLSSIFAMATLHSSPPLTALAAPSMQFSTSTPREEQLLRQNHNSETYDSIRNNEKSISNGSRLAPSRRLAAQTSNSIEINISNQNVNNNENSNYNAIENVNTINTAGKKKERTPTPKPTKRRFRSPPPTIPIPTYAPTTTPTAPVLEIFLPICSNLELNDCCADASVNSGRLSDFCLSIGCSRKRCVKSGLLSP